MLHLCLVALVAVVIPNIIAIGAIGALISRDLARAFEKTGSADPNRRALPQIGYPATDRIRTLLGRPVPAALAALALAPASICPATFCNKNLAAELEVSVCCK
jgi:hypothetical protein